MNIIIVIVNALAGIIKPLLVTGGLPKGMKKNLIYFFSILMAIVVILVTQTLLIKWVLH